MKFYIDFKDLPFESSFNQVIYAENGYDAETNDYIRKNYKALCRAFKSCGYEFCYLPLMAQQLASKPIADYYAPYNDGFIEVTVGSELLLNYMIRPENRARIESSLLYWDLDCRQANREDSFVQYRGYTFKELIALYRNPSDIAWAIIEDMFRPQSKNCDDADSDIRFRVGDKDVASESDIDIETAMLLSELRATIDKLYQKGVARFILEQMIDLPVKLSRVLITSDYRIFLCDYNNMEIKMTPLVKAVYLLFLNHPEGIVFKCLPDYYDELLGIYRRLKRTGITSRTKQSIQDITDPLSNSINEKCARINALFITKFDERLARNYIIQGKRGEPKRIMLPEDLIIRADLEEKKGGRNRIIEEVMHFQKISSRMENMETLSEDDDII